MRQLGRRWRDVSEEGVMAMVINENAKGMLEGNPGEAMVPYSEPMDDDPTTTGVGAKHCCSKTPENADHEINPSAPGQTGTTPHSDR